MNSRAAHVRQRFQRITREDLDRLLAVGFDDRGILQISLIASWFNDINRVADGLGVGREG
jgi:alkylhydroperoxidase family enzyme